MMVCIQPEVKTVVLHLSLTEQYIFLFGVFFFFFYFQTTTVMIMIWMETWKENGEDQVYQIHSVVCSISVFSVKNINKYQF